MINKKILIAALIFFVMVTMITTKSLSQLKIGLINSDFIMQNYEEMGEINKQVAELTQKHQKELADLKTELETKSKAFESQSLLLSEEKKKQTQKDIEDLYRKAMTYQQEKFGTGGLLEKRYKELTEPVIKKINEAISKVSADENYDLVFDIVNMGILYFNPDKAEDITQKILDSLAKGATTSKAKALQNLINK